MQIRVFRDRCNIFYSATLPRFPNTCPYERKNKAIFIEKWIYCINVEYTDTVFLLFIGIAALFRCYVFRSQLAHVALLDSKVLQTDKRFAQFYLPIIPILLRTDTKLLFQGFFIFLAL